MTRFLIIIACIMLLMRANAFAAQKDLQPGKLGYELMCVEPHNGYACAETGAKTIHYSDALFATLAQVNRAVNTSIKAVPDKPNDTIWHLNVSQGDCEEFVMAKRVKLLKMGFPGAALRIATGYIADGQAHAVLLVNTTRGKYVLDILNKNVLPIGATPYGSWLLLS